MAFLESRNASRKWCGVLEFRYPANGTYIGSAGLAPRGQWTLLRDTVQKKGEWEWEWLTDVVVIFIVVLTV